MNKTKTLDVVHNMSKVRQDFLDRCAELKPLKLSEGRAAAHPRSKRWLRKHRGDALQAIAN